MPGFLKTLVTRLLDTLRAGLPMDLPAGARLYVGLVQATGVALLVLALASARLEEPARFLLFLLLGCLASVLKITVPLPRSLAQQGLTMSLSFTMNFAALLILGVHQATVIAAAGAWTQCTFNVRQKNPGYRTLFSVAAIAVTLQATGWVYAWCGGGAAGSSSALFADEVMALAAAACTHFVVNSGLVAGAIALSARQRLSRVWAESFATGWVNQLLGATLGVLLARGVGQTRAWLVPITGLLLMLTYRTYRAYNERIEAEQRAVQHVSDLHEATLEALALAIDAKDRESRTHMRRLQACSLAIARAEGLAEDEAQAIKTAALLHDIGLLAVPQHILAKAGRLSAEELRKLRSHPQVGAEIIRGVPFPSPVAPIILAHHERWDGTGYPAGLKWEAIPLGARVLAIADRFDKILNEQEDIEVRSSAHAPRAGDPGIHGDVQGPRVGVGQLGAHAGMDEAASLLRAEAGHALDPRLVARFLELLPGLEADLAAARDTTARADDRRPGAALSAALAASDGGALPGANPFDNIALAHLEAQMLYDIAQALSPCLSVTDAMTQLASRLDALVPASTCALFLCEEDRGHITCRAALGQGAAVLEPVRVAMGAGPIGWVVEQARPLVNVSLTGVGSEEPGALPWAGEPKGVEPGHAGGHDGGPADGVDDGVADGRHADRGDLRSALICPLPGEAGCLGALVVARADQGTYHDDHRRILEHVAEHVSGAIQNALRFERTHEAALTDRLTGLTNSRGLAAAFDGELGQEIAAGETLAVLMIDVDNLKAINDTYGHAAGDRALREVARVLSHSIRARDVCARYAGDEFVLVLRACGRPEGERRGKALQTMFEDVRIAVEHGTLVPIHISIGAAACPADGQSLEALLVTADRRMYRDKIVRKAREGTAATASFSLHS